MLINKKLNKVKKMKCSFCGGQVPEGRGKMYVKNDGRIFNFCNSKCQKNWKMGRDAKNIKWTITANKLKGKE